MKAIVSWRIEEEDFTVEWLGATPEESQFHYAKTIDDVLVWCRQQNIGYIWFPDAWVQIVYDK